MSSSPTASLSAYNWISPSLAAATRDSISFLPLVSVVLMYTGFGLGYGPIVFMLQGGNKWRIKVYHHRCQSSGELLPSDMRSLGCGILGVLDNISLFISVKAVPSLVSSLGMHGAFALYSSFCLLNIIISFFVMPETKGLSLEEIEESYKKRPRRVSEHI